MDELVSSIVEKTGISPEQATQAAQVAVDFIKGKLPASISGQVDKLINSDSVNTTDLPSDASSMISGIAGKFGK